MLKIIPTIVAISILIGQLIKIPVGKQGGITILDMTVIALSTIGLIKSKFHLKSLPGVLKIFFAFILICLISLLLTPLHLSTKEYVISFFYTARLFFYALFFWLLYSQIFRQFENQIIKILLYCGLGLALLGLLQFFFLPDLRFLSTYGWDPHFFRNVSTFLDPNFIGAYFVLTLLILISKKNNRLFFFLIFVALLTTFSRSSYGMFLVSFTLFSVLKKSWKLQIITIILFSFLVIGFQLYIKEVSTPRNIDRTKSASFRLNSWQQGLTLFQQFPILGVGFNAYRFGIKEYNLGDEQFIKSHGSSSNDFSLLFIAATTGVLGLFFYVLFILTIFKYSYRTNHVLFSALSGLLFHSIFANSLFYPPIFLWILLTLLISKK